MNSTTSKGNTPTPTIKKTAARKTSTAPRKAAAKKAALKKAASQGSGPSAETTRPPVSPVNISAEERWRMVATAAYHRAEKRGFEPGHETKDWMAAEKEIDAILKPR